MDMGGDPSQATPTEVRGISLTAELNEKTGAVVLPADRFTETFLEMDLLSTAASVALSHCAAEKGVTFEPPEALTDPVYVSEQYQGPWTRSQAEHFGFVKPMTQADLAANGVIDATPDAEASAPPNGDLTDDDWKVVDACVGSASSQFDDALRHVGPWYAEFDAVTAQVFDDPDAKDALHELEECYDRAGIGASQDGSPGWPRGADGSVIDQQQIQLALTSVECKEETDFTARVAGVEARLQAPIVVKYADELVAKREQIDEALAAARALLAEA
ncbi:hypothetical protein [Cellulomonas sp.]|uniref:hypothetical protein n=1 Tax=Cellulomonas sp. TaxID=40001 RepID=UPI00258D966A|nr:hypothetical protein [Cellulomonas sp.]MCR6688034.1 hypothetical protein [Cellulomonas sp.]